MEQKQKLANQLDVLNQQLSVIHRQLQLVQKDFQRICISEAPPKPRGPPPPVVSLQDHFSSTILEELDFTDAESSGNSTDSDGDADKDAVVEMQDFKTVATSVEPLIILYDLETTGLGKSSDICITEIGAILIDQKGSSIDTFRELVCPLVNVSNGASKVTGHTHEKLQAYDFWKAVGRRFYSWIESHRHNNERVPINMIAHNGSRYDSRILFFENQRHRLEMPRNCYSLDSLSLFKIMYPKLPSYGLGAVYKAVFDEPIKDAHTAVGDAQAIRELIEVGVLPEDGLLKKWIRKTAESFDSVAKRCLKK